MIKCLRFGKSKFRDPTSELWPHFRGQGHRRYSDIFWTWPPRDITIPKISFLAPWALYAGACTISLSEKLYLAFRSKTPLFFFRFPCILSLALFARCIKKLGEKICCVGLLIVPRVERSSITIMVIRSLDDPTYFSLLFFTSIFRQNAKVIGSVYRRRRRRS